MNRPSLILLVGIPGSGKTTYADGYMSRYLNTIHLSSDKIRAELWGNEAIQGDNDMVFSIMQSRAIEALHDGKNVIYDATNITRKDRAHIINMCPKFVKIEAHVVWAPIEICIERDASRERTVGKHVIDKMLKRFQPPFYDEGIQEIKIIVPDGFDSRAYLHKVFDDTRIPHDNPHHTLNIYEHCKEAYVNACMLDVDIELERAAMMHDIGKPYVKAFFDTKENPSDIAHYYSHHNLSAWMSYGMANTTPFVAWLVGNHMDPFLNTKYYRNMSNCLKKYIDMLHECDLNAH